ncbi:unnamed protein product [Calypogeia fissa]
MAKRPRRRIVVLESDDDEGEGEKEEEEKEIGSPARHSRALRVTGASAETGVKSDTSSKRKLQKLETKPVKRPRELSQQPTLISLFESGRKSSSRNGSYGTLPLEVVTKPAAKPQESSRSRKGRDKAKPEDHPGRSLQHVDDRLWVDKYTPKSVGELVVHTKKVAEVKEWLQRQLLHPYGSLSGSRVLMLTGPAGVGKTAVVHVLADVLGVELTEWTTPAPELWQEYSHHASSGLTYVSKLDEFEGFLERARKMSSLPIVRVALSTAQRVRPFSGDDRVESPAKSAKVLLIDDLPILNDREQKQRLAKSLFRLALSRDFPTIVVVTEDIGAGVRLGDRDHQHKDVVEALERGGAKKIGFNPVTVNAAKKLLTKVQLLEKCRLSSESISAIAESSAGDIRQALTSLQFLCLGCHSPTGHHLMWDPGGRGSSQSDPKNLQIKGTLSQDTALSKNSCLGVGVGRDYSLSLFHALGKFLHNKRLTNEQVPSGSSTLLQVKEEFQRYPLDMEEPEIILSQAQTDSSTLLAFLHENVLQFIDEDATDDVVAVSAYLSDTDCLLGAPRSFRSRNIFINPDDVDPSQVATAVANSVAARGVLFGNGHPAPRRWQSLRAPALWQVERQNKLKKMELSTQGFNGIFNAGAHSSLVKATELHPFSRHLSCPDPSRSSSNVVGASNIVEVEDSMLLDEHNSDLQFQSEKGVQHEHLVLESTLMKMCVEDDIEDPDD